MWALRVGRWTIITNLANSPKTIGEYIIYFYRSYLGGRLLHDELGRKPGLQVFNDHRQPSFSPDRIQIQVGLSEGPLQWPTYQYVLKGCHFSTITSEGLYQWVRSPQPK